MLDFEYSCPTRIVFGNGRTNMAGSLCKAYSKVMLVYGSGSVVKNGILATVASSLEASGISSFMFGGVHSNPELDKVEEGRKAALENKADFILAVGGGSVIDTAKAIAVSMSCDSAYTMYQRVCQNYEDIDSRVPVGVVLTIAASGSETGESFVISHQGQKLIGTCRSCAPAFAVLDPLNTLSLPAFQTACGAADILSHLQERYFASASSNDLSDQWLEAAMRTVIQTARLLMDKPDDVQLRASMMWVGTLAHNGLLDRGRGSGDWACHMIEHELSAKYPITHGEGLAMITGSWLRHCMAFPQARPKLGQLAQRVWLSVFANDSDENIVYGITAQEDWYRKLGLRTSLSQFAGVCEKDLEGIASSFAWEPGDLVKLTPQSIKAILLDSYSRKD